MNLSGLLVTLGILFLAGLTADQFGRVTRLPRVTMLLLLGLAAGNAGLDLIPDEVAAWFDTLSIIALTMVAFLLGGSLSAKNLAKNGRPIFMISLAVTLATLVIVAGGLWLAGLPAGLSLILGAVATATAPAALTDVIRQSGIDNGFTDRLKGIVAIDDAWGLIVFSICLVFAAQSDGWQEVLAEAGRDLGGAVMLGIGIGLPAAALTGRLLPGEPLQAEAIGIVFLTAGLALWFEVSFLIAGMTAGAMIANFARHHDSAFHEIEHIQWPFMILFFLLAGASLEIDAIRVLGMAGVLFVLLRTAARFAGGIIGARLGRVPRRETLWYGPALLPQAGVAVGMALVAGERLPDLETAIMAFTIMSTVVFELLGPPVALLAIRRVARDEVAQGGAGTP